MGSQGKTRNLTIILLLVAFILLSCSNLILANNNTQKGSPRSPCKYDPVSGKCKIGEPAGRSRHSSMQPGSGVHDMEIQRGQINWVSIHFGTRKCITSIKLLYSEMNRPVVPTQSIQRVTLRHQNSSSQPTKMQILYEAEESIEKILEDSFETAHYLRDGLPSKVGQKSPPFLEAGPFLGCSSGHHD
ncbi:hypothetical protein SADUNF_Sadunf17G0135900 [Salix dunnii]|uniref:Uncharacterized protein n=1 Tax=Salix dunnii TaxID=1413687 RepID=A0A835J662_9ROSI|nr:hypothetical protein SADUNF_Sadunf17G0135900 [Salix dunnii]